MGGDLLRIWVGGKFEDPAVIQKLGLILAILTVGHCLRLAQHSNFIVLVGRGEHKIFGVLTALTGLLCVFASVVSVKVFGKGLLGIAWSNALPMALVSGLVLPIYFNKKMNISISESIRRVWLPAFLGSLPCVVMIGLWKCLYPPAHWFDIIAVVLCAMLAAFLGSWLIAFSRQERRRFLRIALPSMAGD